MASSRVRHLLVVTGVLLALTTVGAMPAGQAATPGTNGRLVVAETVATPAGGRTDIRSMAPDGTSVATVVEGAWQPAWSPDGRRIAYTDYVDEVPQTFVVDADGTHPRQVTHFVEGAEQPAWSPDGSRLAVARYTPDWLSEIWTVSAADGTAARRVVAALDGAGRPTFAWDPSWSVDGVLAYSAMAYGPTAPGGNDAIHTIREDGTGHRQVTPADGSLSPDWAPDGRWLAFERRIGDGPTALFVIRADGTGSRRLVTSDGWAHDPFWAPDAARVAFTMAPSGTPGGSPGGVYVVDADGTDLHLVHAGEAVGGSWQALPGPTTDPVSVDRFAGDDRVATAIAIARASYPASRSATAVVLARSDAFPDALAGAPLAAARGGPLLLTPGDRLDDRVMTEVLRVLAPDGRVYLLGGRAALSTAVQDALEARSLEVQRLGGVDRYATAARIAAAVGGDGPAFLATGANFPDALGAGAAAAHTGGVILLTADGTLPPVTRTALEQLAPRRVVAVGGQAARALPNAEAVAGADRYETARLLAAAVFDEPQAVALASGTTFPDGLAGAPHAGARGLPLLLVAPGSLPDPTARYLRDTTSVARAVVYGGVAAVDRVVTNEVGALLEGR